MGTPPSPDFNDVFGGPPRRHSTFSERRRSHVDSLDRPVFGDSASLARRRQPLSGDFYSDIFPGSDSGSSSPRGADGGTGYFGHAGLPAQISHSMKLSDELRPDYSSVYRQSPLSRQTSHVLEKSSGSTGSASMSFEIPSQMDSLDDYVNGNQFHFSIYKWAGKGVTLVIPSDTKELTSGFRRLPELVVQGDELPVYDGSVPSTEDMSKIQTENRYTRFIDLIIDGCDDSAPTEDEELLRVASESKSVDIDEIGESADVFDRNRRAPATTGGLWNSVIRNMPHLVAENRDRQGKDGVVKRVIEPENISRVQKSDYSDADSKHKAGRDNIMSDDEVTSSSVEDVQVPSEAKMSGSRVRGKVRDFIKIFNPEASPKRKGIFESKNRKSKGKDGVKGKLESEVNIAATKMAEEVKVSSKISATSTVEETAPIAVNKNVKTERSGSAVASDVHMVDDSFVEKKETTETFPDSTPEVINVSMGNLDESPFEDIEGCLVEQLSDTQNELLQTETLQEQIKISDAKILEWKKGKEGNIRSLLSTLQYVLWPESGWKPVPLVNIIEGPSVKRAYQRALLYLHPDKLQQKGAAMHQKYIAEKVFDILQEAWDHFNSISSF